MHADVMALLIFLKCAKGVNVNKSSLQPVKFVIWLRTKISAIFI